jgi:serine/threonine protein phosphatase 1
MSKIYAISDIHGCFNTFQECLNTIGFNKSDKLFLLGDYIDRGIRSIKTIDKIIELGETGYQVQCLTGNHEEMMLESIKDPDFASIWLSNGGNTVLNELGITEPNEIPQRYIDFAKSLKYCIEFDNFIFVHAGLNLNSADPLNDKESLTWIRGWDSHPLLNEYLKGRKVIHGHTPKMKGDIEKRLTLCLDGEHSVLDIDNGCVFNKTGYGSLCCANLSDGVLHFQKNCE